MLLEVRGVQGGEGEGCREEGRGVGRRERRV